MPVTSHTHAHKKQKPCLQGQLRGAQDAPGKELGPRRQQNHRVTLFLPHLMKQGRHCRPFAALIPRTRAWKKIWLQLQICDYFAHRGTKAISIPQGLMMASHSILASGLPIAELPSPSQATSRLHKLTGHSLGHRAPVQGDQMDNIIPVLPTGVHPKQLGERTRMLCASGPGCC